MPSKAASQCFSCLKLLPQSAKGVSLLLNRQPQICIDCWNSLPKSRRVLLQLLARPREAGGLGLREAAEKITEIINRSLDTPPEPPSSPFPWRN